MEKEKKPKSTGAKKKSTAKKKAPAKKAAAKKKGTSKKTSTQSPGKKKSPAKSNVKAAAEKAAAEKAAAEKAAAEKAAAEKAAAEKAAAEKAAAEKAAAEKAAAEKAAAEKAAAEKAAAEKAAAEKAAAEKAAAEATPDVSVSYELPQTKASEPMDTPMKIAIGGFAGLVLLVVLASYSNSSNYYLKPADEALEIWQGKFAPLGEEKVAQLPGVTAPELIKESYGKKEVYPYAFNFYLDRADRLLDQSATPDYEAIQAELDRAKRYAVSRDHHRQINARLNGLKVMTLLVKANVAVDRGTPESLEKALEYFKTAAYVTDDEALETQIKDKMSAIKAGLAGKEAPAPAQPAGESSTPRPAGTETQAEPH